MNFPFGVPPIFHVRTVSLRECNSLKIPFSRTLVYGSNHPGSFFVGSILALSTTELVLSKHTARQFVSKLSPNWDEVALGNAAMTSKNTGSDLQVLQEGLLGGSSRDLDTWLGSPPFISHKYRPFGISRTTRLRGRIKLVMVLNHVSECWDDPPSKQLNQASSGRNRSFTS